MPSYKVSYKILRQQGEDMKAVAKLIDGYSERVAQVSGKLGEGDLLAQVRTNLGKLREQLTESRTVINTAGEFLTKTVDSYTGVELRQVKKADSTRAHNRDFYKNPVVVASVGGAAQVSAPVSAPTPTVNYTDNSVNVSYVAAEPVPASAPVVDTVAAPVIETVSAPVVAPVIPEAANANAPGLAGIAAGAGVAGGVIGAGAVIGVKHLVDEHNKDKAAENQQPKPRDGYDPEEELKKALKRVKDLEEEG